MGAERGKKQSTIHTSKIKHKLSNKAAMRPDKATRIRKEKEVKRQAKRERREQIVKNEDEHYKATEEDADGFYKVPAEVALELEDEKILEALGAINLGLGKKNNGGLIAELEAKIEKDTQDYKEVGMFGTKEELLNDPQKNEKVRIVYKDIAEILAKYRAGKLPKALQVVPMTANTFQLLDITEPENWSRHTCLELTKQFSVTMTAEKFRVFLKNYIVPAARKNIKRNKKMSYHHYCALRRGLFKPASWFRGVLFPMCEDVTTSIKEAEIVASILLKKSIPSVHSAISLLRLTQMPYTGATNILIYALVRKKYALPRSVVDALVDWITSFEKVTQKLPVVWFKTVLSICQTYSKHFSQSQKNDIKTLVKKVHRHNQITPEIVRAIVGRGESLNVTMLQESVMV